MAWSNSISQREKTFDEKFWEKVDVRGEDECWEWMAARSRKGYGNFYLAIGNSKSLHCLSHRMAYILSSDSQIPEGMLVCHKCDNPPCCNPKHLFLGTVKDNAVDMWNKGRSHVQRGNKPHSKINQEQANEIRRFRNEIKVPLKILSYMYNLDVGWIVKIAKGRIWKGSE